MTQAERSIRLLLGCGMAGPPVVVSAYLWAAARHAGYNHVSDTISKLSAQGVEDRWPWTAGLLLCALLLFGFASGLQRRLAVRPLGKVVGVAMRAHALLLVGVALLRDDLRPGGFFTVEGAAHDVISGVSFSALLVAMATVGFLAHRDPSWRWLGRVTLVLGVLVGAVAIVFLFTPPRYQGVPQRGFTAAGILWIEIVATWALGHPYGGG